MAEYIDNAITLETKIDGKEKTLRDLITENRDVAKSYVFENIKDGLLPDEETLKALNIRREIKEPTFTNIVFDRHIIKDNKVYQKDTAKLATILKELNTIEKTADKFNNEE